ncbi:uncharacterized protein LOC125047305 [Penaeus chinensis]|uniref:uncharacterized protein LOC125047305 n=1 Tax=Penaeus chinensis TaxID=139456 RepID=UPI001FB5855F|nr:uncharacterized protein LOC125047305 [Penaeus chinensis]
MGEGSYGRKFLNGKRELVFKHAKNLEKFRIMLLEAVIMNLFVEHHSFQRLVGVCPYEMCLVTRYAGHTLGHYIPSSRFKPEHRYSVMTQVCNTLQEFHNDGFAHNNLSLQSVCVKLTVSGPKVTLSDFGLAMVAGRRPRLGVAWTERSHFAPEICGAENPGCCGWQSDAYSVGKLMHQLFGSKKLPLLLNSWYVRSQDVSPSERRNLASLIQSLKHHKMAQLRLGY